MANPTGTSTPKVECPVCERVYELDDVVDDCDFANRDVTGVQFECDCGTVLNFTVKCSVTMTVEVAPDQDLDTKDSDDCPTCSGSGGGMSPCECPACGGSGKSHIARRGPSEPPDEPIDDLFEREK